MTEIAKAADELRSECNYFSQKYTAELSRLGLIAEFQEPLRILNKLSTNAGSATLEEMNALLQLPQLLAHHPKMQYVGTDFEQYTLPKINALKSLLALPTQHPLEKFIQQHGDELEGISTKYITLTKGLADILANFSVLAKELEFTSKKRNGEVDYKAFQLDAADLQSSLMDARARQDLMRMPKKLTAVAQELHRAGDAAAGDRLYDLADEYTRDIVPVLRKQSNELSQGYAAITP